MGDINTLGRNLNSYLTSILTLFRLTGDKALLTEVDRIMELERAKLSDCEYHYKNVAEANPDGTPVDKRECTKDGFLNLIRRPKNNEGADLQFIGNDHHEMDEILSHSIIAEVAYALFLNQDIGAFGEHAKTGSTI
jgi:hypothetical protein